MLLRDKTHVHAEFEGLVPSRTWDCLVTVENTGSADLHVLSQKHELKRARSESWGSASHEQLRTTRRMMGHTRLP